MADGAVIATSPLGCHEKQRKDGYPRYVLEGNMKTVQQIGDKKSAYLLETGCFQASFLP